MAEKELKNCAIICGAPGADIEFLRSQLHKYSYIICADSGYKYAKELNIIPDLIVGDFDSYFGDLPDTEVIRLNTHKDDTDTIHCCKEAITRDFEDVTLFCALGGRFDHSYANLCSLKYLSDFGVNGRIVSKTETIEYKEVGEYTYKNLKDKTFSVFPFACNEANVTYVGKCEYPLKNSYLNTSLAVGVSNVFRDNKVTIKVNQGSVLIIIEDI